MGMTAMTGEEDLHAWEAREMSPRQRSDAGLRNRLGRGMSAGRATRRIKGSRGTAWKFTLDKDD